MKHMIQWQCIYGDVQYKMYVSHAKGENIISYRFILKQCVLLNEALFGVYW